MTMLGSMLPHLLSTISPLYLIPYVEATAAGGRTSGREVGYDDGGKHAAPPALYYHHCT